MGACFFALGASGRAAAAALHGLGRYETAAARLRGSTHAFVRVLVCSPAGSIPVEIGNLTALTRLFLCNNKLTGAWALASPSAARAVPLPPPAASAAAVQHTTTYPPFFRDATLVVSPTLHANRYQKWVLSLLRASLCLRRVLRCRLVPVRGIAYYSGPVTDRRCSGRSVGRWRRGERN